MLVKGKELLLSDRSLLEDAAKAAGIEYDAEASKPHPRSGAFWGLWLVYHHEPSEYDRRRWNPLTDDGDALRLQVKLNLGLVPLEGGGWDCIKYDADGDEITLASDFDPKRAITRAAAAISSQNRGVV